MKKTTFHVPLCAVLLFIACDSREPQNETISDVPPFEEYFDSLDQRGQFNGTVLVAMDDQVIFEKAFGKTSAAKDTELTIDHQFRLASVSKQFTAMAIMLLENDGVLTYDQDITDFIPELPYEGVTIQHLLQHTGGLADYMDPVAHYWKPELAEDDPAKLIGDNEDLIRIFAENPPEPDFAPGERWEYSNTGYVLLASIVERASKTPFPQFMKERIFDPLGMDMTSVYEYKPGVDESMPLRTFGFRDDIWGGTTENDYNFLNGVYGDGGMYSNTRNLYSWHMGLLEDKLLPRDKLMEAYQHTTLNDGSTMDYGFGWGVGDDPDSLVVGHSGGWVGYATFIERNVDKNICFILLTNNGGPYLGDIIDDMRKMIRLEDARIPGMNMVGEIARTVKEHGVDSAVARYEQIKSSPGDYKIDADQLNAAGYHLMGEGLNEEALAILLLNLEEYPDVANGYDSAGDAYLEVGDSAMAYEHFMKAYEMDSTFKFSLEKAQNIGQ